MKYFALPLALAGAISAAEFHTGQAARAVIGQETFTRQQVGTSSSVLGAVSGVAYANDTLIVADSSRIPAFPQNQRVLIYRGISEQIPDPKASSRDWSLRCPVCRAEARTVLGQSDFSKNEIGLKQNRFRTPTAVATDGRRLVVADTDNNRVLIWNSIPESNEAPADLVLGQKDFGTAFINFTGSGGPNAQGMRGPQGVWIQGNRLYVADTQNNRILIWTNFPTQNGQAADVVLGAPNFTTFVEPDLTRLQVSPSAKRLLNPVSVTSDGTRLFVTDLGHNRVVVWNSIPTQSEQAADFVLGQPDITGTDALNASDPNNSPNLCPSNGTNSDGKPTYPYACGATLSFPRFALSDGTRLFIADGGNDRILVYNTMPTRSGQPADAILGQAGEDIASDTDPFRVSASDTLRTPSSLAWDGTNLYVADPFNRRIMVFSMGEETLPVTSVRNAASRVIFAGGTITFSADPKENDEVTVKIANSREYKYKAVKDHKIANAVSSLVQTINAGAGDPDVFATGNPLFGQILLRSRTSGEVGNNIAIAVTVSTGAQIQAATSSATLTGGKDTTRVAPGTIITILGDHLADVEASGELQGNDLPHNLAGVEVYVDGLSAPLLYVSPSQINSQLPFEITGASSVSLWVRIQDKNGNVRVTNAVGVPVVEANPGIFALEGDDPREAIAFHATTNAVAVLSVDGTPKENDVVSITLDEGGEAARTYSYTVKKDDNLTSIRDGLIAAVNDGNDPQVTATPGSVYARIVLQSRTAGTAGEGLKVTAKSTDTLFVTPYNDRLCCSSQAGGPITEDNPARPGELITIYATGLGSILPVEAREFTVTGSKFQGPDFNFTNTPVDDAIAGGRTAQVIYAGLKPGSVGIYEVKLLLNSDIPTNSQTQLTIAQGFYVSNIVTFPVVNPNAQ